MGNFGCGKGGWTPVMKIDGAQRTFHFDSLYWSNQYGYNIRAGRTSFDTQETKLPTYWMTPFTKICLGMKIDQMNRFTLLTLGNKRADSLLSLITDGDYRSEALGRDAWMKLVGPKATLSSNCIKEGFNVKVSECKARIGVIANQGKDCNSCDSRIGFGTGGYPNDFNTCGDEAVLNPEKTHKHITAMGYILVQ
ncbi:uncharacterized skeletal organic matrix protein 5-like [Montipora foliosa]|uniref:uncharacterized skeletal organic matrix protein 5-like n=1 Tax=Montipora foliosa TaxID=591990 RepID=UPI0035F135CF